MVAGVVILAASALPFLMGGVPGDLSTFADATPEQPVMPSCRAPAPLQQGPLREGGAGNFFLRSVARTEAGELVLTRSLDGTRLRFWWGAAGILVLVWVAVLVVFNTVDTSRIDAVLDRRPKVKVAFLVGAGLPLAGVGLGLLAVILVLLPTLPYTLVGRHQVMQVEPSRVVVEARRFPWRTREAVVPADRIVGVDTGLGVRIAYRDEDDVLRAVRVPIADEASAVGIACAAARVLQASQER